MTTELTHEQAIIARMMLLSDKTIKHMQNGHGLVLSDNPLACLSIGNASEMLAAYDAKWVMVEWETLYALLDADSVRAPRAEWLAAKDKALKALT